MKGLYALLVLVFATSVYAQDPEITEAILPEIKRMGVTGRLVCVVINQNDNPLYWIHKDTQTTISTDDKIVVDEKHNPIIDGWPKFQVEREDDGEKRIYTIIINRLEPRDAGIYTCQVLFRGSDRHPSKDGEMVVLVSPAITYSQSTHTISAKVGDAVNLTCDATGYPTPNTTWVRVNAVPLPNGELRYQSRFLYIPEVTKDDRGVFRCLADNNVRPPAQNDATLQVYFTPEAAPIQSSYGQAENRMFDVTIECRVAGWPEPELQWYQEEENGNWKPINNDDKHTINILLNHANILQPNERWFNMVIRSVQANDYGNYFCEGRNTMGSGHGVVRVFATSECQGPNCPVEQQPEGSGATNILCNHLAVILLTIFTSLSLR